MNTLAKQTCRPCEGGTAPLADAQVAQLLSQLTDWQLEEGKLVKTFRFRDHYQAVAFVNAVAWISHTQDHHPVVELGYNTVRLAYWTHAIGGLSVNDFICAAKVDSVLAET